MNKVYIIRVFGPGDYYLVGYRPDAVYDDRILLVEGRGKCGAGTSTSAQQALRFSEHFTEEGAGWFIPYLKRMASEEIVPVEEFQNEYKRLFGEKMTVLNEWSPSWWENR